MPTNDENMYENEILVTYVGAPWPDRSADLPAVLVPAEGESMVAPTPGDMTAAKALDEAGAGPVCVQQSATYVVKFRDETRAFAVYQGGS